MADEQTQPPFNKPSPIPKGKDWPAFRESLGTEFRGALAQLQAIWAELPGEWTEVESGITFAYVKTLLWRFDREAGSFWSRL